MIKVDEITMRYLELLNFEVIGYQNILKKIAIYSNDIVRYTVDKEIKEFYLEKYIEKNKEFEIMKSEMIREYVPNDKKDMIVNFNFENLSIEFIKRGACLC